MESKNLHTAFYILNFINLCSSHFANNFNQNKIVNKGAADLRNQINLLVLALKNLEGFN